MRHSRPVRGIPLTFLVLVLITLAACAPGNPSTQATETPIPTPIVPVKPTYTVERGDVVATVQFNGQIAAVNSEQLFFRVNGRVRNLYVKEGDTVQKGEVLADLEQLNDLEKQQSLSDLAVKRAEIQLEMAQLQLQQTQQNAFTQSQKTYDVPLKQYQVDLAQIALDETKLNNADLATNIQDAQVISPIDGVLLTSGIKEGDDASAYKAVMTVVDPSELEVSAELDSVQLGKISRDLTATITAASDPNKTSSGKVRRLPYFADSSGTQAGQSQDTSTRISMDTPPSQLGLQMGDKVSVVVLIDSKQNALWLPPQAIRSFEGRTFVIVQEGQNQRRVDIKTGVQSDDRVEVVSGLDQGQVVVGP